MRMARSTVAGTDELPPLKFAAAEQSVQFLPTNKLDHRSSSLTQAHVNGRRHRMEMHMKHIMKFASAIGLAATLMSGTARVAIAQVDDPPGSVFQDRGLRESEGLPALPGPRAAARRAYAYGSYGLYNNYVPERSPAIHYRTIHHSRSK
jgi:hypothetical protein